MPHNSILFLAVRVLIFLFLLGSTLLFSVAVEGLKKLLHFDRLVARLSDWACRLLLPKETE